MWRWPKNHLILEEKNEIKAQIEMLVPHLVLNGFLRYTMAITQFFYLVPLKLQQQQSWRNDIFFSSHHIAVDLSVACVRVAIKETQFIPAVLISK